MPFTAIGAGLLAIAGWIAKAAAAGALPVIGAWGAKKVLDSGKSKQKQLPKPGQPGNPYPAGTVQPGAEGDWFNGTPAKTEQLPRYTPEQQQYLNDTLKELTNNPANFQNIENDVLHQFKTKQEPAALEQLYGNPLESGSGQAYKFASTSGDLASILAAMRGEFAERREARQQNLALKPSFENLYFPREPGLGEQVAANATQYI